MKEATHIFCMTFGGLHTVMVEVVGPEDWTKSAREAAACAKVRENVPFLQTAPLTTCQYCGTATEVVYVH